MTGITFGTKGARLLRSVALAAAGLAALHALLVWPAGRELARLEEERFRLSLRQEEHAALLPVYAKLRKDAAVLNKSRTEEGRLPMERVSDIPKLLGEMAARVGVLGASFAPEPTSLDKDGERILVVGGGVGDYRAFKTFLDDIGSWPPLDGFERIEARGSPQGLDFRLRAWIGLRQGGPEGKAP